MPVQTRKSSAIPAQRSSRKAVVPSTNDSGKVQAGSTTGGAELQTSSFALASSEDLESGQDDNEERSSTREGNKDEDDAESGSAGKVGHLRGKDDSDQYSEEEEDEQIGTTLVSTSSSSSPAPSVVAKTRKGALPLLSSTSIPATSPASSKDRLDPSLFADYFASARPSTSILKSSLKKPAPVHPPTQEELQAARQERRAKKLAAKRRGERRGGIVVGRDGRAMKRLKDGRTVVRSLEDDFARTETSKVQQQNALERDIQLPQETYLPASSSSRAPEDQTNALAVQKSTRFLKRKLGLGHPSLSSAAGSTVSKSKKQRKKASPAAAADDPLGLEDPAFLPGGEFAHLTNLTGKKKRSRRGAHGGGGRVEKSDLRGDAVRGLPIGRSGGAAFAFNRCSR